MRHERKLAILFADISTAVPARCSPGAGRRRGAGHPGAWRIAVLIDVTCECGGTLIKTLER
ncbi:MAG: hypothetical protein MZW92_35790 [Comamonadaceae bacterium]|nr:hypothetical protein [Comamonadaceae bacterium]